MAQCSLCSRAVAAAGAIAGALASKDATAALRLVLAALVSFAVPAESAAADGVARACNEQYWSKNRDAGVPLHANKHSKPYVLEGLQCILGAACILCSRTGVCCSNVES